MPKGGCRRAVPPVFQFFGNGRTTRHNIWANAAVSPRPDVTKTGNAHRSLPKIPLPPDCKAAEARVGKVKGDVQHSLCPPQPSRTAVPLADTISICPITS
jgi:hypothetical protein